jgi:hypothetical protein
MNKGLFAIQLIFISLIAIEIASAVDINTYVAEFNDSGETCQPADVFSYDRLDQSFWHDYTTCAPAFYNCCILENCVTIIVDLNHNTLMSDDDYKELIDLNFIRQSLKEGTLTETSFISTGIDSCSFYGKKKLGQETANLIADATEKIALAQKTRTAENIVTVVEAARAMDIVSPFSAVDFGLSIACAFDDQNIKKAVEKLAECNMMLSNIWSGYAQENYVNMLDTCLDDARTDFVEYRDSSIAKVKNVVDKVGNTVTGLYGFFKGIIDNPSQTPAIDIKETEYETAGHIYDEIQNKILLLHNPDNPYIFENYRARIEEKTDSYNVTRDSLVLEIQNISGIKPTSLGMVIKDIFFEPDYNMSEGANYLQEAQDKLVVCSKEYSEVRFNSAINCLNDSFEKVLEAKPIIERELNKERTFDVRVIYVLGFLLLLLSVYGAKKAAEVELFG